MTTVPGETVELFRGVFGSLLPFLNEHQRRLAAGAVARALGHGGMVAVSQASGLSQATVSAGVWELEAGADPLDGRIRRAGAGRKSADVADPGLVPALLALVEPGRRGDPVSSLSWTTLSTRDLARELTAGGHRISHAVVGRLLREQGFVLRGNAKVLEGATHPDRDAQFRHINDTVEAFLAAGEPVASIDAKKKELIGNHANPGRTWHPADRPVRVADHDFTTSGAPTATPFGIYDLAANSGWVNVGTDHATAAFAVESVRRWWNDAGRQRYPDARRLLLTCDAGGANAANSRLFKAELAALAWQTGLQITVAHFPPGTSKWNKIEHRLFSAITHNWRGRPLTSLQVVLDTLAATTTSTGLSVQAELDTGTYPTGNKVTDAQFAGLPIDRHPWHGNWNYTLRPEPPVPPAPARPGLPDTAWLRNRQITGMDDTQFDAVVRALTPPPPPPGTRGPAPGTAGLTTTGHLLAATLHHRHHMAQQDIATLLGVQRNTIAHIVAPTIRALTTLGITLTPATTPLNTIPALTTALNHKTQPACY